MRGNLITSVAARPAAGTLGTRIRSRADCGGVYKGPAQAVGDSPQLTPRCLRRRSLQGLVDFAQVELSERDAEALVIQDLLEDLVVGV
jgi:hypothetical protein